eukprot:Gb_31690 [translate_table: standard]
MELTEKSKEKKKRKSNSRFHGMMKEVDAWTTTPSDTHQFSTMELISSIYSATIALALVYASLWFISFLRRCRSCPLYSPVVGTILNHIANFERLHDYHTDHAERYRTFRVVYPTFSYVFTTDPANVEHILKTNFSNYVKGKFNYDIMKDLLGDGIFTVDGDKWFQQRKLASLEFSTKVVREFGSVVSRNSAMEVANILAEAARTKQRVEMQDLFMKSSLDAICKMAFGVDINSISSSNSGPEASFAKAFDTSNAMLFRRYMDGLWKLKRFLNIGAEATMRKNIKILNDFVYKVIQSRRQEMISAEKENVKPDILSRYITLSGKETENLSDKYLRDVILNFIIAGKDTTALTLSWFMYMLCKHPDIQEKIAQETKSSVEETESMNDFAQNLTQEVLDKMHYLHATLSETLRLYPAVPVDGKCVVSDDILPDGFKVQGGDFVNYVPYSMGRMTYLWGSDAKEFKPERWLHNGIFQPQSPFKFTAFQAGARICLGKDIAYMHMKIVAAVLVRFFKFEGIGSQEVRYRAMMTLHMDQPGLNLCVTPRLEN